MADGTRMKQFEVQLQQVNATVFDLQAGVDSLEAGSSRNHDAILLLDRKFEASMDGLARRLDGFMLMFSKLHQVSLPTGFPPKERSDPILQGNGTVPRTAGSLEFEIELAVVGENIEERTVERRQEVQAASNQLAVVGDNIEERVVERRQEVQAASNRPYFPLPKLEIPLFDCGNPRWWIRQCQKLFILYNILDQQRITLASAYLNDVAALAVSGYALTEGKHCKPFNPLLGEKYDADDPDKELRFVSEKVSHYPMIVACHCEGTGWKFWEDNNLKSKFWGCSIQLDPVGVLTLEFDGGEVFQLRNLLLEYWKSAGLSMEGVCPYYFMSLAIAANVAKAMRRSLGRLDVVWARDLSPDSISDDRHRRHIGLGRLTPSPPPPLDTDWNSLRTYLW